MIRTWFMPGQLLVAVLYIVGQVSLYCLAAFEQPAVGYILFGWRDLVIK
jgi:hypothetical protein